MNEPQTLSGRIRTFLVVTLITVMVWLLAESRMIQTQTLDAQVSLSAGDGSGGGSMVVRLASGEVSMPTLSIQIEGSTAALDRFSRVLQNRVELRVGREIPTSAGVHQLDLRSLLRQSSEMSVHGLTITSVTPETLSVEVDELETREFRVRVVMPTGVELDGAPRSEPATIKVTAPASVLFGVESDEALVRVSPAQLAQLAQGRLETIPGVSVDLPELDLDEWATRVEPGQVDVLVTIRSRTQKMTMDRMPVQVLLAPDDIGDWRVQIDDADKDIVNVEIEGPAESIDLLRSGAVVPKAFIVLSFEDLERQIRSKSVQVFGLPAGCRLVSPDMSVNLGIERAQRVDQTPMEPAGADPGG